MKRKIQITPNLIQILIILVLLTLAASMLIVVFRQLPFENEGGLFAIDWRWLYAGLENGGLRYGPGSAVKNPPWSLWLVRPLGILSLRDSWAILTLVTLGVLIVSVPKTGSRWVYWSGLIMLITAYPAVRHIVDGNFEALIIAGVLLLLHAVRHQNPMTLAIGILLTTAKPQEVWLLLLVLSIVVFKTWPARKWITAGLTVLLVIGLSAPWLLDWWDAFIAVTEYRSGSILDISLIAALGRLGTPLLLSILTWGILLLGTVWASRQLWVARQLITREWAAFLIATSMLLAPYSAGNSVLVVLAIGIIPLFQRSLLVGALLVILIDVLYFTTVDFRYWYQAYFSTGWLILTWGILWYKSYEHTLSVKDGAGVKKVVGQGTV